MICRDVKRPFQFEFQSGPSNIQQSIQSYLKNLNELQCLNQIRTSYANISMFAQPLRCLVLYSARLTEQELSEWSFYTRYGVVLTLVSCVVAAGAAAAAAAGAGPRAARVAALRRSGPPSSAAGASGSTLAPDGGWSLLYATLLGIKREVMLTILVVCFEVEIVLNC